MAQPRVPFVSISTDISLCFAIMAPCLSPYSNSSKTQVPYPNHLATAMNSRGEEKAGGGGWEGGMASIV